MSQLARVELKRPKVLDPARRSGPQEKKICRCPKGDAYGAERPNTNGAWFDKRRRAPSTERTVPRNARARRTRNLMLRERAWQLPERRCAMRLTQFQGAPAAAPSYPSRCACRRPLNATLSRLRDFAWSSADLSRQAEGEWRARREAGDSPRLPSSVEDNLASKPLRLRERAPSR
jgi:hypothetical protein